MRSILPFGSGVELSQDQILDAYGSDIKPNGPMVRINMVTSLDGASDVDGRSIGLSGTEDRQLLTLLRVLADVVLVGAGTLRRENYNPLALDDHYKAWRRRRGMPENPRLAIVSSQLDLDPRLRALADAQVTPLIITRKAAAIGPRHKLASVAEVINAGDQAVDLGQMLEILSGLGYRHILCEGGPHLLGTLTAAELVDEFCLTTTPILAGPSSGRISAGATTAPPRRFRLQHLFAGDDGELYARYKYCNESG